MWLRVGKSYERECGAVRAFLAHYDFTLPRFPVSRVSWAALKLVGSKILTKILDEVSRQQSNSSIELWISLAHDIFNLEENRIIKVFSKKTDQEPLLEYSSFQEDPRTEPFHLTNLPVEVLLDYFEEDQLVRLFELLLIERKIILVTKHTRKVALFVECLFSLMFPL